MRNFFWLALLLMFSILNWHCQTGTPGVEPPKIRYGEDACDECRMIINEARFAGAYFTTDKKWYLFDDVGCMLNHLKKYSPQVEHYWVADYNNETWLDANKAVFVLKRDVITPMGFGIIALGTQDEVKSVFKGRSVKQFTFSELQALNPEDLLPEVK
ncbi:MAG: hypothetical protein D6748_06635 [Calditrichaeota bacterium]|nr:MAG: hypothetical protein D6748_06635 [Calditrichota bacterium]